ncbi:pyridoxal-phosphate dependent enzyme [Mycena leptocephala]|nr:pyridoxal-phosphate dependent enzyme [Mycena leptocephala]
MADPSTSPPLTRASVQDAQKLIEPYIHKTPVLTNTTLSTLASTPRTPAELEGMPWASCTPAKPVLRLWFKCENFQRIGVFKIRGAFHAIEQLKCEPAWAENGGREKGVVTHSSGNQTQALTLAARENNIPAYIVMPTISAAPKIAATKGYGVHVIFSGSTSVEREARPPGPAVRPPRHHSRTGHPRARAPGASRFGSRIVLALLLPHIYAPTARRTQHNHRPCGGGGMLAGVALSCEVTGIRVFGAKPSHEGADDCARGFYAGTRIGRVTSLTIADGLRTPVGVYPWSVIYEPSLFTAVPRN